MVKPPYLRDIAQHAQKYTQRVRETQNTTNNVTMTFL